MYPALFSLFFLVKLSQRSIFRYICINTTNKSYPLLSWKVALGTNFPFTFVVIIGFLIVSPCFCIKYPQTFLFSLKYLVKCYCWGFLLFFISKLRFLYYTKNSISFLLVFFIFLVKTHILWFPYLLVRTLFVLVFSYLYIKNLFITTFSCFYWNLLSLSIKKRLKKEFSIIFKVKNKRD